MDWLQSAGQSWWQILPLGPPDEDGSPYKAASAFACWNGFLAEPAAPVTRDEVEDFVARHPFWTGSWAAFAGDGALADQVRFEREWSALRRYAADRGIRVLGDLPIYVAPGGADHKGWPELFQDGVVGGVPPDDWSAQRPALGEPALRLGARAPHRLPLVDRALPADVRARRRDPHRPLPRLRRLLGRQRRSTGRRASGSWRRGPGRELFDAVRARTRRAAGLIAEDLGTITPPVERLRDELGLPGHARPPLRLRRGDEEPAAAKRRLAEPRRLHGHARQRHDRRLVAAPLAARARPRRHGGLSRPGSTRRSRTGS